LHFHHERFPSYLFTPVLFLIVMLFWSDVLGVVEEFEIVEVVHNWWRCCIMIMCLLKYAQLTVGVHTGFK
jgi:hypothetical protein